MPKTAKHHGVDTSPVTIGQVKYATVIAFLAWTFAVYDFILFGMLLPEIGKSLHLDTSRLVVRGIASEATWPRSWR